MLVTLYKLNNCPCLKFDQDESTFSKYYRIKKFKFGKINLYGTLIIYYEKKYKSCTWSLCIYESLKIEI